MLRNTAGSRPPSRTTASPQPTCWSITKKNIVACLGEFVGTVFFLWISLAATSFANIPSTSSSGDGNTSNTSNILFIALAFGFSLAVNAWIFFRVSGGLFNPSITFGLMLTGIVPWFRGALLIITQLVAGIVAAYLVAYMFPTIFRAETTLNHNTSLVQGLFIEVFLTAQLVMAIFMLAAEKSKSTFIAPVGIGLAFFVCELVGVYYTGGSLNPARSLGPAIVNNNFPSYHWIYWLGPFLGTLLAAGFYMLLKIMEYRTVLPDQDADGSVAINAVQAA
jgi:aquaporin rerated protein, other eukaryote